MRQADTPILIEVCVDSAAGLAAAVDGGADRIELCAALAVGGLTPSAGLMQLAATCGVPVRAMIRPREGDFAYSSGELAVMHSDITAGAAAGLEGVVFGVSRADGHLDREALSALAGHARGLGLKVAMHRAFDLDPQPLSALEDLIAMEFDTVLTSGGANTALAGVSGLTDLVAAARGRIEILAGVGVTADNAAAILVSGVLALHASCSMALPVPPSRAAALGYVRDGMRDTDSHRVHALRAATRSKEGVHV